MAVFYFTSSNVNDLKAMLVDTSGSAPIILFPNARGPLPATPAATTTNLDGTTTTAPAAGVAGQWYLTINDPNSTPGAFAGSVPASVTQDAVNGEAVLGTWC